MVRGLVGVKKVGHAGTLDPFADGVLLICTGRSTKKVPHLMSLHKEYLGRIKLGYETDTEDITGKIISAAPVPRLNLRELNTICQQFVGNIPQIPPMFSAKKVGGQRLYKIARRGNRIKRTPTEVTIYSIEVVALHLPFVTIKIKCSKGTYIRALARDIGRKVGCGAYLYSLTRTRIGDYKIEDSLTICQFTELLTILNLRKN